MTCILWITNCISFRESVLDCLCLILFSLHPLLIINYLLVIHFFCQQSRFIWNLLCFVLYPLFSSDSINDCCIIFISIFYRIHLLSSLISFLSYFLFFNPLSFIPLTCNPIPFCELFVSYSHGIRLPLHSSFARESAAGRYQMQFLVLGSSCRRRFHVTESSPKEAIRELG